MHPRAIVAAVVREKGGAFILEHAQLDQPRPNEVLVKIIGTGICHTDMSVRDQQALFPLPAVFGHEGAGIVEQIGSEVTRVVPGDHVVLSFDIPFWRDAPSAESSRATACPSISFQVSLSYGAPDNFPSTSSLGIIVWTKLMRLLVIRKMD